MKKSKWIIAIVLISLATTVFVSAAADEIFLDNGFLALYYHVIRLEERFPQIEPVETSVHEFERAVELGSSPGEAYLMLGIIHQTIGQFEQALDYFEKSLESEPENGWILVMIGDLQRRLGNSSQAQETYELALEYGGYARAHYGLGELLLSKGLYAEAAKAYSAAFEEAPEFFRARVGLGKSLYFDGELAEAVEALEYVQLHSPRFADVHYYLGLAYDAQGFTEKAEHSFERARQLDSSIAQN